MSVSLVSSAALTMHGVYSGKGSIANMSAAAELLEITVQHMKDTAPGPGPRGVVLDRRV